MTTLAPAFAADLPANSFAAAIQRCASIVPRKATVPLITCVLIRAGGGKISIVSTDMNQALGLEIEAMAQGAVCVNAARMVEISSRLDANHTVQFKEEDGALHIKQGRTSYRVPLMPVDDFPAKIADSIVEGDGNGTIKTWDVAAERLVHCLDATEGSVSVGDMTRPALGGAYFDFDHDVPKVFSTDGHVVTSISLADLKPPRGPGIIVPNQAFKPIADFAKRHQAVKFIWNDSTLCVEAPRERFRTRLINPPYPNLRPMIPDDRPTWVKAETEKLKRAIDRVSIIEVTLDDKKSQTAQIQIEVAGEELVLSSYNHNGERAVAACECARLAGDNTVIHVNAKYIAWAVASLGDTPYLNIGFDDPSSLMLLHRSDDTERKSLRGLMPMRGIAMDRPKAPAEAAA